MAFIALVFGCVILLAGIILLLSRGAVSVVSPFDRLSSKFPGVASFFSGALMAVFPGFIPAAIIYASTGSQWIAAGVWGVIVLACGAAWFRFTRR